MLVGPLPEFITFTGVDEKTEPSALMQLARDYPIELGLLFSPTRTGVDPRYPSLETISRLTSDLPLRFAAHLCGGDAASWLSDRCAHNLGQFQRVQINTSDPSAEARRLGESASKRNLRAIMQSRGPFPLTNAVDVLYDASGGRGIMPSVWPTAVNTTFCGYAGGLNPENVAAAVAQIGTKATRYWIDMETGVRDEQDWFSIEKCRAVCEAVYGSPRGAAQVTGAP